MGFPVDRRQLLYAGCALLLPSAACLQPTPKAYRIGVLSQELAPGSAVLELLYDALARRGYEENRNVVFDHRFVEGPESKLAAAAADLVGRKVDLIVVGTTAEALAARRATSAIPIVMWWGRVPVEAGLVASLARPGRNVTGVAYDPETAARKLRILHEAFPLVSRAGLLWDPWLQGMEAYAKAAASAAPAVGLKLTSVPAGSGKELEAAFDLIVRERIEALIATVSPMLFKERARIVDFAARRRLPVIYSDSSLVMDDGLMSDCEDSDTLAQQVAAIVDRILKGEKPAQVAVEHPKQFLLTLNLRTAKALGLTFPPSLLKKADEVVH